MESRVWCGKGSVECSVEPGMSSVKCQMRSVTQSGDYGAGRCGEHGVYPSRGDFIPFLHVFPIPLS